MAEEEEEGAEPGRLTRPMSDRDLLWAVSISSSGFGLIGLEPFLVGRTVDWVHPVMFVIGMAGFVVLLFTKKRDL